MGGVKQEKKKQTNNTLEKLVLVSSSSVRSRFEQFLAHVPSKPRHMKNKKNCFCCQKSPAYVKLVKFFMHAVPFQKRSVPQNTNVKKRKLNKPIIMQSEFERGLYRKQMVSLRAKSRHI